MSCADSDSCILLKGPCGGTIPTANKLSIVGGTNFTVIFQKNLNHFNEAHPGYWSVSMARAEGSSFTELFRITDTDVPSLTLYTATVTAPEVATGSEPVPMVLQTRYVTNNPKAPSAFYQCGDVLVRRKD
ncbi:uncharacterized protein LOC143276794 isoform X2 [Babylonia areolata]|uniref:uncharacterized protein LOC143276794 isoform X2 n=1 Tax=Babylonia areolata TaxID=304850 RepID=UPI003FD36AF0